MNDIAQRIKEMAEVQQYTIPSTVLLTRDEKYNVHLIFESIQEVTDIPPGLFMITKSQKAKFVYLRQITAYMIRNNSNLTLQEIGAVQGYRDHTTVIHSCSKVQNWMEGNPSYAYEKKLITEILKVYGKKREALV